jgi:hypothetical protein
MLPVSMGFLCSTASALKSPNNIFASLTLTEHNNNNKNNNINNNYNNKNKEPLQDSEPKVI